jgi:large conductance mechanosensitive channel
VPDPTTKTCPECLSTIPIAARRCAHCTSQLSP